MHIDDLGEEEIQVFAGLVVHMVLADGEISEEELEELEELGEEFGAAFQEASAHSSDLSEEEVLDSLASVTRPAARELILTMLHDMASSDGMEDSERVFLDQVRARWTD